MQPLTLAATLLATSCLIIGCSRSEAATIAGTYNLDLDKTVAPLVEQQAKMANLDEAQKKAAADEMKKMMKASLELKEDMTFTGTMDMMGGKHTMKGTWKVSQGTITFEQTHEDGQEKKETQSGAIKDGVISITRKEEGQEATLYFTKGAR
jgi:hypothetical protein